MVDIDHFKAVNDGQGHAVGDLVLKEVANRMAASCRSGDLLGRVGGEEFLAVFADVTGRDAQVIAERLREAVERTPVSLGAGSAIPVTVSGGLIALTPADAALYRAKQEGRNRVVCAD
jgi:diguanylate cyclase (GGDEF)-like protein